MTGHPLGLNGLPKVRVTGWSLDLLLRIMIVVSIADINLRADMSGTSSSTNFSYHSTIKFDDLAPVST